MKRRQTADEMAGLVFVVGFRAGCSPAAIGGRRSCTDRYPYVRNPATLRIE